MDPLGKTVEIETKNDKELSSYSDEMMIVTAPVEDLSLGIAKCSLDGAHVPSLKKKLIVLDINGLLADVVSPPPKDRKADATFARRAIFQRPSYFEFLEFCFDKFEVGIWSSRMKKNVDRVINFLMGDMKNRLLFCWDLSQCTETSFKTLENKHKYVVFKDLRKLWDKHDPNLPWEKGYYNESNTLLLDDSPYKALLNPPNTSVFPRTFTYQDESDNSLAEGGDLRAYLDGLANAEDMHKYVEEHPFGQEGISEASDSWNFYRLKIVTTSFEDLSSEITDCCLDGAHVPSLKKKLIVLDINGLLADVVSPPPKDYKADATILEKAIFKRPSYLEFLEFCFDKFEVGIWSSGTRRTVVRLINFLMGDMKNRLLFCWDLFQCTKTSFKILENRPKYVVFKELRKLWDKHDPKLPWEKGYYNESNTLLLDDSPYKALLNPPNTSVFPRTFTYQDESDNSLDLRCETKHPLIDQNITIFMAAEGGDLRVYLDGLANAEDMRKYIEEHPFGQEGISEASESWNFYRMAID
ncbi:hypothetical protein CR513_48829, partial [Mucuna pruriens]